MATLVKYTCKSFIKLTSGLWFSLLEIEPRPTTLQCTQRASQCMEISVNLFYDGTFPRALLLRSARKHPTTFHSPHA